MRKVVITDRMSSIKKYFQQENADAKFIMLNENVKTLSLKEYLLKRLGIKEISRNDMSGEHAESFKREFCKIMRSLNYANNSIEWWAMNFTNKNPLASKLSENIFSVLSLRRFMTDFPGSSLIILSDNKILARQLRFWAMANNVTFYYDISVKFNVKEFLRNYTPLSSILIFFKILTRKFLSSIVLERITDEKAEKLAIVTQFEKRSIIKNGLYKDIYFGDFKELLKDLHLIKNLPILTVGYSACNFIDFIVSLKKNSRNADIYPMEYFIKINDMLRIIVIFFKRYFAFLHITNDYKIQDFPFSVLLQDEIKHSVYSGQLIVNMSVYFSMLSLSQNCKITGLWYPFENRSWEKMLLLACKKGGQGINIFGYQHSAVIQKHLNFCLEPGEYNELPMPDQIVCLGEATKSILEHWGFPKNIIRTGCALRHREMRGICQPKIKIKNILVTLASDLQEYVRVLIFLDAALGDDASYDVVIRPHPVISFKKALGIFNPKYLQYRLSESSLEDDMKYCDIVLYASSTVCLDAISIGRPVICLELDDFLDSDPLFNFRILKWNCSKPGELVELIKKIDVLKKCDIYNMRQNASEYTSRYFGTVNKENLSKFIF